MMEAAAIDPDLSRERYRRAMLTAMASFGSRIVTLAASLVSVPLTLHYLGVARYGVWMTLSSFGVLLAFADVGVGNGLINAVATANARGDTPDVRRYVSSALVTLSAIGAIIVLVFLLFRPFVSWSSIMSSGQAAIAEDEVRNAVTAFVVCFALSQPSTAIYRVMQALQQGYTASLWQLGASVASLGALLLVIALKGGLVLLVLSSFGTNVLVGVLAAIWSWSHGLRETRPVLHHISRDHTRRLFATGGYFLVLQITSSIAFAADNLIIAHVLGPATVARYSVVSRVYEAIVGVAAMIVTPLWPAFADAAARNDHQWAAKALARSFLGTLAGLAAVVLVVVIASEPLMHLWLGSAVPYSLPLFISYGIWAVIKGAGAALGAFLNGTGLLRQQMWIVSIFATVSVLTRVWGAEKFGLPGVPLALSVSYIVCIIVPFSVLVPRYFARTAQRRASPEAEPASVTE